MVNISNQLILGEGNYCQECEWVSSTVLKALKTKIEVSQRRNSASKLQHQRLPEFPAGWPALQSLASIIPWASSSSTYICNTSSVSAWKHLSFWKQRDGSCPLWKHPCCLCSVSWKLAFNPHTLQGTWRGHCHLALEARGHVALKSSTSTPWKG